MAKEIVDIDSWFDEIEKCTLDEINPKVPGWKVILYFGEQDFEAVGTPAQKDLWKIEGWEALGYLKFEVAKAPTKTVTLTYNEDCVAELFSAEQLALFNKYAPFASAPLPTRRVPTAVPVLTEADEIDDDSPGTIIQAAQDEFEEVFDEEVVVVDEAEAVRLRGFKFELVELHLSPGQQGYDDIVKKIEKIADDEELDVSIDAMPSRTLIYLYRQEGVNYAKPMEEQNAAELEFYLSKIL